MTRKKILVVDDDAVVVKSLVMKLTSQGYDVASASDASGAVQAAREQQPDLIILDVSFPPDVAHGGMVPWDGFNVMEWLKRLGFEKDAPVIVVTGGEPAKYRSRAMAAGAVAFFQKPVESEELLEVIRLTVGKPEVSAAPNGN
jgi:CheY-like chemotaxis protein